MLTFYYLTSNSFTDQIEEKLSEMVAAHKIVQVNGESTSIPDFISKTDLPVLFDGYEMYSSPHKIERYLDKLHQELNLGRSMQSDSCHLDPDNPEECL
ncbi:MAG TPA: hypothetical protein VF181_04485 [Balneolaceae bacterium]